MPKIVSFVFINLFTFAYAHAPQRPKQPTPYPPKGCQTMLRLLTRAPNVTRPAALRATFSTASDELPGLRGEKVLGEAKSCLMKPSPSIDFCTYFSSLLNLLTPNFKLNQLPIVERLLVVSSRPQRRWGWTQFPSTGTRQDGMQLVRGVSRHFCVLYLELV